MTERTERMAYSVDEVCAMLGVSVPTVYKRINDGSLRSTKWGRRRLILRVDVEEALLRGWDADMGKSAKKPIK